MIARYLDVSTGHLTRRELDTAVVVLAQDGPRVIAHEYGMWVNVQHDDVEDGAETLTAAGFINLLAVIRVARALGPDVNWINFDADGETLDQLGLVETSSTAENSQGRDAAGERAVAGGTQD